MNSSLESQEKAQTEARPARTSVATGKTAHYAVRVIPPRTASRRDTAAVQTTMANLALDEQHPVALELVGSASGPAFVVRATTKEALLHLCDQIRACYPQAGIHALTIEDDPLYMHRDETLAALELRAGAAPYLSLRTFESRAWAQSEGADPIVNVLAALAHLPEGMRVIAQLAMLPARPQWSRTFWRKAIEHPLEPERKVERKQAQRNGAGGPSMAALFVLAAVIVGALVWRSFGTQIMPFVPRWLRQDAVLVFNGHIPALTTLEKVQLAGAALVVFLCLLLLRWCVSLIKKPQPLYNMQAVSDKTKQVAYQVRLRLIVIGVPDEQMTQQENRTEPSSVAGKQEKTEDRKKDAESPTTVAALSMTMSNGLRVIWGWMVYRWQWWRAMLRRRAAQRALLTRMTAAYRQYHQASGGYFFSSRIGAWQAKRLVLSHCHVALPLRLLFRLLYGRAGWEQGITRSAHYLSVEELATLWHLPPEEDISEVPLLEHGRASTRLVPVELTRHTHLEDRADLPSAFRVGVSEHVGYTLPVFLSHDCFHRNLLAIAKTGKGKSTLLILLALAYLRAHADEGLLFMEPHGDTITTLLGHIPQHRHDDVTVIDLAAETAVVGLNPLDMAQGRDRDKTVENLLTVFIAFWKKQHSWGPRTENVLQFALLTLCEANERKVARDEQHGPDKQYTLLDVIPLLRDVSFRHRVLEEASDLALHEWWQRYYETMEPRFQNEVISPVLNKISKYGAERLSRRILGQARSTVRLGDEIARGNILLINTASSIIGVELSSLLGATIMGLFHLSLAEQARLAPAARRQFLVYIDEFQTYTGIDYNTMLAELRKYGGTFGLATQSLSYLDTLDPSLRATVLSNIDHLFAFLMSAEDARTIAPNLDGLLVDDILNLDDYTCYAKLSSEGRRLPTFSLKLDPPPRPDEDVTNLLRVSSQERNSRHAMVVDEELSARARERALVNEQNSSGRRSRKGQSANADAGVDSAGATSGDGPKGSADSGSPTPASVHRRKRGSGNRSRSTNDAHATNNAQYTEQRTQSMPSPVQSTPLITSSDADFGHMLYDVEEPREQ